MSHASLYMSETSCQVLQAFFKQAFHHALVCNLFYFNLKCQYMRMNAAVRLLIQVLRRTHCPLYHLLYLCSSDLQLLSKHREEQRCIRSLQRMSKHQICHIDMSLLGMIASFFTYLTINTTTDFFLLPRRTTMCSTAGGGVCLCQKRGMHKKYHQLTIKTIEVNGKFPS